MKGGMTSRRAFAGGPLLAASLWVVGCGGSTGPATTKDGRVGNLFAGHTDA